MPLIFSRSALASALALAVTFGGGSLAQAAAPDKLVQAGAKQSKEPALKLLEQLVNIDSGSGYEPGLSRVSAIVIDELKKLGATIETFPNTAPDKSKHVVATLKGTGKAKILLMAHMDTVFKEGSAAARPFHIKDGRAYGPGVMDDKGGIVAGIYALQILKDLKFTDYAQITFLLDASEETGSDAATDLIKKTAKQHDVTLNLEPGRPADGLVVWRKGSATAEVDVKGKASHAGVAPELGRNAAMEAAHQILQLGKLGDAEKKTTINFTVINGGDRTNVIPDHATAKADVRAAVPEEFDRIEKDLARVSANKLIPETEVSTKLVRGLPPMPQTPENRQIGGYRSRHLRRTGPHAHHRRQRWCSGCQPGRQCRRAYAGWFRHCRRQHPHARRIRRSRKRLATDLPADAHDHGAFSKHIQAVMARRLRRPRGAVQTP